MASASRVGDGDVGGCDVGLKCCPHSRGGTIMTGSVNVYHNNKLAAIVGSTGGAGCPHGGTIKVTRGSSSVFINGKSAARVNDSTTCIGCGQGGHIVNGSNNVYIGG